MKPEVHKFIQEYIGLCEQVADGRRFDPLLDRESARMSGEDSFIDYVDGRYQKGYFQRGISVVVLESSDKNEVMYKFICSAFGDFAWDYEKSHRPPDADIMSIEPRIVAFKKRIEYMRHINTEWAKRLEVELSLIAQRDGFSISD